MNEIAASVLDSPVAERKCGCPQPQKILAMKFFLTFLYGNVNRILIMKLCPL